VEFSAAANEPPEEKPLIYFPVMAWAGCGTKVQYSCTVFCVQLIMITQWPVRYVCRFSILPCRPSHVRHLFRQSDCGTSEIEHPFHSCLIGLRVSLAGDPSRLASCTVASLVSLLSSFVESLGGAWGNSCRIQERQQAFLQTTILALSGPRGRG
jgi:hypothetical protein